MTTATALGPAVDIGERVIERARRGDQEAFAAVIRYYDPGLRALAFRLLGDRDLMDDVLQDAYVKAFKGLPRFRLESKLGTWLYRIAYNAAMDELRRARRGEELPLEAELPGPNGDPGDVVAERAAVLLVDAQGFDYRESAQILGIPQGTVASRLNRARASLRTALGQTG
jgi:RNA polymerase sigma-70 factor, ECF subfamily